MEARETLRKISALPPEAQAIVLDLLETLSKRYSAKAKVKPGSQMKGLRADPFIGMWRDHEVLNDASAYVRDIRRGEWERRVKRP
jgi:hypothetical protein